MKSDSIFFNNAGKSKVYYMNAYVKPEMAPFTEVEATPADPVVDSYQAYDADYGYGAVRFNIQPFDVNGKFINPADMTYRLFVNDNEEFILDMDTYVALTEDMTVIPYNFTDNWDIYVSGTSRTIYFYEADLDRFGAQVTYTVNGKANSSKIVYANFVSTAVNSIANTTGIKSTSYTDVSGRSVASPSRGLYIKTIKYNDGSVKNVKVMIK